MKSKAALVAALAALLAAACFLLGPLLAHFGLLPPLAGFMFFALHLPLAAIGLGLGLLGLFRTRKATQRGGASRAWAGILIGGLLIAITLVAGGSSGRVPPIHDITTDLDDPPAFVALAQEPDNQGRDLSYPHGGADVPEQQRGFYTDLAPLHVGLEPVAALQRARSVAEQLGWQVVEGDGPSGRIEATDTSFLFRFVDDIVIRVRPGTGGGAVIDLRSTSRVGQSDLGANAARISAFQERFTE